MRLRPVDFFGSRCGKLGTHGNQGAVAHMDIGVRQVAQLCVHGDNIGIADDELAAWRQLAGASVCASYPRRRLGIRRAGSEPRRTQCRDGTEKAATT